MWLLVLVLVTQSAPAQPPEIEAQGLKALDNRDYAGAAALFSQAIAADPKDYSAHFNLGLAYSMLHRDAEAIPEYKTVLELHPGLYEAELNLGILLLRTNDAAGAVSQLQRAAEQKPKEFRPQFYLGEALFANRQFAEAETAYRAALGLDSGSAAAQLGLGRAVARQGRRAEAEALYRKAAALDPAERNALLELGELYEENRQTAEAIAIYREFSDNPGAQERLGALLLESGHAAEAVAPLEFAVAKSPTPANKLALAQAYAREKQPAKAESLAADALAAAPDDLGLRLFYARLLRDERKFPQAAAQFLTVAQKKPDSAEAWTELSGIYMVSEDYAQALAALDRVKALGAENPGHWFVRAVCFDHLRQAKEALENYNKFLAASHGEHPDQEFQARQRVRILERETGKR